MLRTAKIQSHVVAQHQPEPNSMNATKVAKGIDRKFGLVIGFALVAVLGRLFITNGGPSSNFLKR